MTSAKMLSSLTWGSSWNVDVVETVSLAVTLARAGASRTGVSTLLARVFREGRSPRPIENLQLGVPKENFQGPSKMQIPNFIVRGSEQAERAPSSDSVFGRRSRAAPAGLRQS